MSTTPSLGALRAAKALYPNGCAKYCYSTHEENESVRNKDWEAVAQIIDRESGARDLLGCLKAFVDPDGLSSVNLTRNLANARAAIARHEGKAP